MTTSDCPEGLNGNGAGLAKCDLRSEWPRYKKDLAEKQAEHEGAVIRAVAKIETRIDRLASLVKEYHDHSLEKTKTLQRRVDLIEEQTNPDWDNEPTEVKARRVENFRDLREQMQAAIDRALLAEKEKLELEQKQARKYRRELILKVVALMTTACAILITLIDKFGK